MSYAAAIRNFDYDFVASPSADFVFQKGMSLADIEKVVILETLKGHDFNRTYTAKTLGIGIRTLQRKIKQYRDDIGDTFVDPPVNERHLRKFAPRLRQIRD
jgi:transcriptional regulator of acetoin/glycerol metabolism